MLKAAVNKIHTTELGISRIRRNLALSPNTDVVEYCKEIILNADKIENPNKNFYVYGKGAVLTVNASSYCIITARKE